MILNETVAAIADAIREKTGKSELIKPVDFAEEIKGITAGGSGESGDDGWEYYEFSETVPNAAKKSAAGSFGLFGKGTFTNIQGNKIRDIFSFGIAIAGMEIVEIEAFATNIGLLGIDETQLDSLLSTGWLVEITKEQFYTLE